MKAITGEIFDTAIGLVVVYNEQEIHLENGECVLLRDKNMKVKKVIPPSKPGGKWSFLSE